MSKHTLKDRGQALVIVAFGLAALIGMAALAIDGGSIYSDRRHAQNAADTAVLAAGLSYIRNPLDWSAADAAGMDQAAANGYDNNLTTNVVEVYQCTDINAQCNLPPAEGYTDDNPANGMYDAGETFDDTNGNGVRDTFDPVQFVQATIESHVSTYLARVVGITEVTNNVEALAQAVPPSPTDWYNGYAIVATMPGCKPSGWPSDPFKIHGTSSIDVHLSGVFINAYCADDDSMVVAGSPSMDLPNGEICVVGTADDAANALVNPVPHEGCGETVSENLYQMPAVDNTTCGDIADPDTHGVIVEVGAGEFLATPGHYTSPFPSSGGGSGEVLRLMSGVYCLNDGMSINSGANVTTDLDGVGAFDGSDGGNEGVLFYLDDEGVSINGGATLHLGAMNNDATDDAFEGYLFYLPPTNSSTVSLNGGGDSTFIGTILAPSSLITIEGNADVGQAVNYNCQIIGYSVDVGGTGELNIEYDGNRNGRTWTSPVLQLYR